MPHHMQISRKKNLDQVRKWIAEAIEKLIQDPKRNIDPSKVDYSQIDFVELERKCMLVLGCTREKAKEYIQAVKGET